MIDRVKYKDIISRMIAGQTQDDLNRTMQDGFLAIRDDDGKLIFRYHPILDQVEVQRRGKKTIIELKRYKNDATMIEAAYQEQQSDPIAIQQDGDHAGQPND